MGTRAIALLLSATRRRVLPFAACGLLLVAACATEDETPSAGTNLPEPSPVEQHVTYVVEPNDTLANIAARFDVPVTRLAAANDLENPAVIEVGAELQIPVLVPAAPQPTPRARNPFVYEGTGRDRFDWLPFRHEISQIERGDALLVVALFGGALLLPFVLQIVVWLAVVAAYALRWVGRRLRLPVPHVARPRGPKMGAAGRLYARPWRWLRGTASSIALGTANEAGLPPAPAAEQAPASPSTSTQRSAAALLGTGARQTARGSRAAARGTGAGAVVVARVARAVAVATARGLRRAGRWAGPLILAAGQRARAGVLRASDAIARAFPGRGPATVTATAGVASAPALATALPPTPAAFRGTQGEQLRERLEVWELRRAFELHELRVHFRTVLDVREDAQAGRIAALAWQDEAGRWRHIDRLPAAMAGAAGLLPSSLARLSVTAAAETLTDAEATGWVSVPLSLGQLAAQDAADLVGLVLTTDLDTSRLRIDLAESELARADAGQLREATRVIDQLREAGVRIVLGGFDGTLAAATLGRLGIEAVSISLDGATSSETARARIAESVVAAQALGLTVLADGVAGEQDELFATQLGCRYLVARPVEPSASVSRG